MANRRVVVLLAPLIALVGGLGSGCAATLKPVYPTVGVEPIGPVQEVRFSPDQVSFEEPGIPIATGHLWRQEVATYTAERLNTLLETTADAPVAKTRVTFELHGPTAFQIGSWKEMTIAVTSQLPDGRVVRTTPKSAYIDNNYEYIAQQVLLFGGPIFEVAAFVFGIYVFSMGLANFTNPLFCGCVLALAFSGLALNVAQAGMQWVIAVLEERRASDLYQEALVAHAADLERTLRAPPALVPGAPPPAPGTPQTPYEGPAPPALPPAPTPAPTPVAPPPPLLDDPADDEEGEATPPDEAVPAEEAAPEAPPETAPDDPLPSAPPSAPEQAFLY